MVWSVSISIVKKRRFSSSKTYRRGKKISARHWCTSRRGTMEFAAQKPLGIWPNSIPTYTNRVNHSSVPKVTWGMQVPVTCSDQLSWNTLQWKFQSCLRCGSLIGRPNADPHFRSSAGDSPPIHRSTAGSNTFPPLPYTRSTSSISHLLPPVPGPVPGPVPALYPHQRYPSPSRPKPVQSRGRNRLRPPPSSAGSWKRRPHGVAAPRVGDKSHYPS